MHDTVGAVGSGSGTGVDDRRPGAYVDLVSAGDLTRLGAAGFLVVGACGVLRDAVVVSRVRSLHGAMVVGVWLLVSLALFAGIGLAYRVSWRKGMAIVAEVPTPHRIRSGWRALPGVWIAFLVLCAPGAVVTAIWDLRPHTGHGRAVAALSFIGLTDFMLFLAYLFPFVLGIVLWRAHSAVRRREATEHCVLLGNFDQVRGLGVDRRGSTYLWPAGVDVLAPGTTGDARHG